MGIETIIQERELRKAFEDELGEAQGVYVRRPKTLSRLSSERQVFVLQQRSANLKLRNELEETSEELRETYKVSRLEAMDLTIKSRLRRNKLLDEGVVFGGKPFNFVIDTLEMPKDVKGLIDKQSENAMLALRILSKNRNTQGSLNPVESAFEELKGVPNAARIDMILTPEGTKIIEINTQWVDAIGALSGFNSIISNNASGDRIISEFSRCFDNNSLLALIDVPQSVGSRKTGAVKELKLLATKLSKLNRFRGCEVINPYVIRLDYLKRFNAFYVNCDPKYFGYNEPDWIMLIRDRVKFNPKSMYPLWRPSLDLKTVLLDLCDPSDKLQSDMKSAGVDLGLLKESIAPTKPLAAWDGNTGQPVIIKGDGYSLDNVFLSTVGTPLELNIADEEASNYIVQPFLNGLRTNAWVYDTGSEKIRYLEDAYTKLNVWYLNGKVVGMMTTISESPLISDKGYNTIPHVR